MSVSPEQRSDLRRVITEELRSAWLDAIGRGISPAALADLLDECRRAVESSVSVGDDPHDLRDDPIDGLRIVD